MLNDITLRLYNLYHWEPLPRRSHIIYSHYPLPKSSIVNPIWLYGGRCWERDLEIWLCTYNFSFWRLTQAIFITKVPWPTNSQLTKTKNSVLIPSSDSISMSHNYLTPSHRQQIRWVHWALWFTTLDYIYIYIYIYICCLKARALESVTMSYRVEAKELRYLLWIQNHLFHHLYYQWIERIWQDWNVWDYVFFVLCLRAETFMTSLWYIRYTPHLAQFNCRNNAYINETY
jgi:hypothetical protein